MIKKILILIITILYVESMFIGKYGTTYNQLNPLFSFTTEINLEFLDMLLGHRLSREVRGSLSSLDKALDIGLGIYGLPMQGLSADKTFNVVYHNKVRDWLIQAGYSIDPREFNVNARIGIFEPNGISTAVDRSAQVGRLSLESVSIHGDGNPANRGIYYSPDNVRFKISDDRQVASFWSLATLPDDSKKVVIQNRIDQEISARGGVNKLTGVGNETRTLLMSYATQGNLPAVRYLVEQKGADVNVEDTFYGPGKQGRTALIFPAYFGHADIVEYFASDRFPKMDTSLSRIWANGNHQDAAKASRIIAALNRIDAKPALQNPFSGGGRADQKVRVVSEDELHRLSEQEQIALAMSASLSGAPNSSLSKFMCGGQAAFKTAKFNPESILNFNLIILNPRIAQFIAQQITAAQKERRPVSSIIARIPEYLKQILPPADLACLISSLETIGELQINLK